MRKYGDLIPCFDCEEVKPRHDYHRSRMLTGSNLCKACANRRSREWRKNNPDRVREHNKIQRPRNPILTRRITCLNCGQEKGREDFAPSRLANRDRLCRACSNERSNRDRRRRKGLPPKEPRPQLPDWSVY